jgi:hypothetical protein
VQRLSRAGEWSRHRLRRRETRLVKETRQRERRRRTTASGNPDP